MARGKKSRSITPNTRSIVQRGKIQRKPQLDIDQLTELKIKLQAVLFSIEDGIVMTDFEDNILLINDQAKKILSIHQSYPYEKKFLDYIIYDPVRIAFSQLIHSGQETSEMELKVPHDSGQKYIKVKKNIVTTAQGDILGRVLAVRDSTIEQHLNSMKDDFMHSITHDLKSPLTSIQGYLDLFMADEIGTLSVEQKKYMEIMDHSAKKLLKLINNILDMSKLEAGKMELVKESFDVSFILFTMMKSFYWVLKQNRVNLYSTLKFTENGNPVSKKLIPSAPTDEEPDLPQMMLKADMTLLERVISNLVDNALKFTSQGGEIEVIAEDLPDRVQFSVRDTGDGIPPEALEKIFHKFKQVTETRGGTGLGLTISKYIVDAHKGEISVTSKRGEGTTFTFWIPKGSDLESY